ncbi:DUF2934 domain-containing protein [Rhodopseudomonas sp. B29]|uniref:DUF2934 domain-containing protein n=1 Tax=Rhodopseudomonas sp. B29 TaxID=95607 RepID=UPI000346BD7F|nr:DUF2934 domain-containing protein [Rhodopseudomonas sp. B29]
MQDMEQAIRERAYHLWNEAGQPEGQAESFWLSAQRELLAESLTQIASVKTGAPKAKAAAKKASSSRKRKAA